MIRSNDSKIGSIQEFTGNIMMAQLGLAIRRSWKHGMTKKRVNYFSSYCSSNNRDEIVAKKDNSSVMGSYILKSTSLLLGENNSDDVFNIKGDNLMSAKSVEKRKINVEDMSQEHKEKLTKLIDDVMGKKPSKHTKDKHSKSTKDVQVSMQGDGRNWNDREIFGLDEELDDSSPLYVAAMHCIPNMGATTVRHIIDVAQSAKLAWRSMYDQEVRDSVLDSDSLLELDKFFIGREEADLIFHNLQRDMNANNIGVISYLDKEFPRQLENIYNPPAILFFKGNIDLLKDVDKSVAMVGARSCSTYGRQVAHTFAKYFAEQGVVVISGGARGVDTHSHQGALDANRMPTIVVMGCGLAITYPWENKSLFEKVIKNRGLLLSEYPPYVPAHAKNFPMRNRLISGLARATIVVEAKKSSGSLITADMASNDGREVYTIPGNVLTHFADGNHWLLRQGATVLTHPKYLLEDYGWEGEDPLAGEVIKEFRKRQDNEDIICRLLSVSEVVSIDELIRHTELPREKVYNVLVQLEIKGLVKRISAQGYLLAGHLS